MMRTWTTAKNVLRSILAVITATLLLLAATNMETIWLLIKPLLEKITPPNWADVVSSVCSIIAVSLGVVTYIKWKDAKIQEDLYKSIRTYIETHARLCAEVRSSYFDLNGIIPQAGSIPLTKEEGLQSVQGAIAFQDVLYNIFKELHAAKEELAFWGVKMSPQALELHESTARNMHAYMSNFHATYNTAGNFYSETQTLSDLQLWAGRLNTSFHRLELVFAERRACSLKKLFYF